jgi:hypothetical protein
MLLGLLFEAVLAFIERPCLPALEVIVGGGVVRLLNKGRRDSHYGRPNLQLPHPPSFPKHIGSDNEVCLQRLHGIQAQTANLHTENLLQAHYSVSGLWSST